MTQLLYHTNSYLQNFQAVVTAVDETNHSVLLDQTVFHPGVGGQPADTGTLFTESTALPVIRASMDGKDVWHMLGGDAMPLVGAVVTGQIDWQRRYQLMRVHSALHILRGVLARDYAARATGAEMQPLDGWMDFDFAVLNKDLLGSVETALNREVQAAREIREELIPVTGTPNLPQPEINYLRIVEIVGLDPEKLADKGTHVHNTREVGHIRLTGYQSNHAINKRIFLKIEDKPGI